MDNSFMLSDKSEPMNPILAAQSLYTRTRMAPFIAILFFAAIFASGCVIDRHGRVHVASPVVVQPRVAVAVPAPVVFTFSDHHRHSARNYYHEHPRHHGKKRGWKNKRRHRGGDHRSHGFRRHDHLPRGIEMHAVHGDLIRELPHAPHGTRYIYHEDQVLLINLNTRVILDFIDISVSTGY